MLLFRVQLDLYSMLKSTSDFLRQRSWPSQRSLPRWTPGAVGHRRKRLPGQVGFLLLNRWCKRLAQNRWNLKRNHTTNNEQPNKRNNSKKLPPKPWSLNFNMNLHTREGCFTVRHCVLLAWLSKRTVFFCC